MGHPLGQEVLTGPQHVPAAVTCGVDEADLVAQGLDLIGADRMLIGEEESDSSHAVTYLPLIHQTFRWDHSQPVCDRDVRRYGALFDRVAVNARYPLADDVADAVASAALADATKVASGAA